MLGRSFFSSSSSSSSTTRVSYAISRLSIYTPTRPHPPPASLPRQPPMRIMGRFLDLASSYMSCCPPKENFFFPTARPIRPTSSSRLVHPAVS